MYNAKTAITFPKNGHSRREDRKIAVMHPNIYNENIDRLGILEKQNCCM